MCGDVDNRLVYSNLQWSCSNKRNEDVKCNQFLNIGKYTLNHIFQLIQPSCLYLLKCEYKMVFIWRHFRTGLEDIFNFKKQKWVYYNQFPEYNPSGLYGQGSLEKLTELTENLLTYVRFTCRCHCF